MKLRYFTILFGLLLALNTNVLSAQEKAFLSKKLSVEEKELLPQFKFRSTALTPGPTTPVRAAAEWEEVEYLVLTWQSSFQNILKQIVATAVNECKVIITTQHQSSVSAYLTSNGISLTNITFLNAPWDSIWIRDYAGNTIYSNDVGERALTDWIYNRPRPNDNTMPSSQATLTGIPIFITDSGINDLVNTGGNYMSDGLGNAFASNLILDENAVGNPYGVSSKTETQIDNIMFNYMGISNFMKMPTLPFDEIHHIDMHMKLLDEETLLVSRYPAGIADGPQIVSNINAIVSNHLSPFGTPYKVSWIDAPPNTSGAYPDTGGLYRTFTNSVFINKSILVPIYRPQVDAAAIAIYQQLLPGYNVVGIDVDNSGENLISQLGALHCITHTIGVANPLWIVHQPIEQACAGANATVNAKIKHISGIASARIYWRETGTTAYYVSPMSFVSGDDWTGIIPIPTSGIDVEYYIESTANSGKVLTRPIVAPTGFWKIDVQTLGVTTWAESQIFGPFPNPASENISFNLNQIPGPITISVSNTLGQHLLSQIVENDTKNLSLNLNPEWHGVLFITFNGKFGTVTKKVIKL